MITFSKDTEARVPGVLSVVSLFDLTSTPTRAAAVKMATITDTTLQTASPKSIYALIHGLHRDVKKSIDTALTWDQLSHTPELNYTTIRPLVKKYTALSSASGGWNRRQEQVREHGGGGDYFHFQGENSKSTVHIASNNDQPNPTLALIYIALVNRVQFLRLAESDLAFQTLNTTRADACELLAIKFLRVLTASDGGGYGAATEIQLVSALTTGYSPFQGAPLSAWCQDESTGIGQQGGKTNTVGRSGNDNFEQVRQQEGDQGDTALTEEVGNALEMAIVSSAKRFLSHPLVQRVIESIHSGEIVYTSQSSRSLINDTYTSVSAQKRAVAASSSSGSSTNSDNNSVGGNHRGECSRSKQGTSQSHKANSGIRARKTAAPFITSSANNVNNSAVYVYEPHQAGWLDHTRLRIPYWRSRIEFFNFFLMTILFIWNLSDKTLDHFNLSEYVFVIFGLGFVLDEFAASLEHEWTIYLASAWNVFDLSFAILFLTYLVMRLVGLSTHRPETSELAFDMLSTGACILLPRLCFFLIKDNMIIISLKAMIADFVRFMALAAICFSGILFTLWTLGRETWTLRQIAWLMLQIWFGSSYLGFSSSASFHPVLGPILLVMYAALSNTLLVTILISILSNRFATINANAKEEHLFQKAINTIEGVKADAIFSYMPPVNLLALVIIGPLAALLDEHSFHRVNVFAIRLTSFPLLIGISAWERIKWQRKRGPGVRLVTSLEEGNNSRGTMRSPISRPALIHSLMAPGSERLIGAVFASEDEGALETRQDIQASLDVVHENRGNVEDDIHGLLGFADKVYDSGPLASPLGQFFNKSSTKPASKPSKDLSGLKFEVSALRRAQAETNQLLHKMLLLQESQRHSTLTKSTPSVLKLFYTDVSTMNPEEDDYERLVKLMDKPSQERIARFHFRPDAIRRLLLLNYLRSAHIIDPFGTYELGYGPNGKPYMKSPHLRSSFTFNISHDHNMVALLVYNDPETLSQKSNVGVDVMLIDREATEKQALQEILEEQLHPEEKKVVKDASFETLLRHWTVKEAFVKADGKGLAIALNEVEVVFQPDHKSDDFDGSAPKIAHHDDCMVRVGKLMDMGGKGYSCAVVITGQVDSVERLAPEKQLVDSKELLKMTLGR